MQPAVVAIAESIETSLLNLFAGFTANTPVGTPVVSSFLCKRHFRFSVSGSSAARPSC